MSDRVFYPLAALIAVLLIALAAVWPQGIGARSPGPFGHETAAHAAARLKKAAPPSPQKAPSAQIDLRGPE
jgi:hypothetical protein